MAFHTNYQSPTLLSNQWMRRLIAVVGVLRILRDVGRTKLSIIQLLASFSLLFILFVHDFCCKYIVISCWWKKSLHPHLLLVDIHRTQPSKPPWPHPRGTLACELIAWDRTRDFLFVKPISFPSHPQWLSCCVYLWYYRADNFINQHWFPQILGNRWWTCWTERVTAVLKVWKDRPSDPQRGNVTLLIS